MDKNGTMYGKENQRPAWLRFLDIILRTAHVLVISVLFGGAVLKIPITGLFHWQYLAAGTGSALIVSEVLHSRHWPYQGRGVLVFIHIGLFSLAGLRPDLALPCLLAAVVVGMFGSHMPKRLRNWSFVHRQVKE